MKNKDKEYILCAAIHIKDNNTYIHQPKNIDSGFIITGRRHHNCFMTAYILNPEYRKKGYTIIQGFITNTDKFVTREEALIIANKAKQIEYKEQKIKLFSEDLY